MIQNNNFSELANYNFDACALKQIVRLLPCFKAEWLKQENVC